MEVDEAEVSPPPNVLLAGIVGSTAYGLAHEGSDIDRFGCYAAPTTAFHGLRPLFGQDRTWRSTEPDAAYHEAGKLAGLLLKGYPAGMDLLWLGEHEVMTPEGEALVAIRSSFLSAPAVRHSYLDFAEGQYRRISNRGAGAFITGSRERTEKHARHLYRLHVQGIILWQTGRVQVRLDPNDAALCRSFSKDVADGNLDTGRRLLSWMGEVFSTCRTPLPEHPDEAAAEAWLQDVRRAYWTDRP